ncbi:MAG: hypothetical protein WBN40_11425 [Pseudomonadales bacterium]
MNTALKKIVVMRHGHAAPHSGSDAERELTAAGRAACRNVAEKIATFFDESIGPGSQNNIKAIYHSPFLRTTQSAQELCTALPGKGPEPVLVPANALLGDRSPQQLLAWLETEAIERAVLLSHQPLVSQLVAWLVDADSSALAGRNYPMAPAAIACLEFEYAAPGAFGLHSLV